MLNGVAQMLGGGTYTIPTHLAFGSTDMVLEPTNTITSGEFDRNILDSLSVTDNTVKYYGGRIAVEADNETINNISLVNSATLRGSADIQSNFLVPSLVHTTNFDISVEFWFNVQRAV